MASFELSPPVTSAPEESAAPPPAGPLPDYPRVSWAAMTRTAGRYPGSRFDDDLARLATGGLLDAAGLLQHARSGEVGPASRFDPRGLAWFAHLRAAQSESPDRAADTAHLFRLAYRVGGRRVLAKQLDTVWVQAAHLAGRLEEFTSALRHSDASPAAWWAAEADSAHPGEVTFAAVDWLEILNRPLLAAELEPVGFLDGPGTAFDRLTASAAPLAGGSLPLVSVVMPVYNPGPSLRTAVSSLLRQSWPNLEILICDDASTQGTDIIADLASQDARVRVVRAPRNAGAYGARNLGIGAATGEFVTFNDADDWAHPRRIERQVSAVLADPAVSASVSWSIRLSQEMRLTVMGRVPERINLSSILFRRAEVLSRIGGFDAVRKGADSEFVSRFVTVLGADSLVELVQPLSMVQLTAGSLSRDDYQFLRTHPARLQYMADFRHWHTSVADEPATGYVPPGTRPAFPAPAYLLGRGAATHEVDVLLMADLDDEAPTVVDLAAEVGALTDLGLRVGLLEYLGPFDMTRSKVRLPTGDLAELVRTGRAVRVLPGEQVSARVAVVRDPAAVQTMPAEVLAPVSADRTLVVADYAPMGRRHYCPTSVTAVLRSQTRSAVRWLPATDEVAGQLLSEGLGGADVSPPGLFGAVAHGSGTRTGPEPRLRVGVSPGSIHRLAPPEVTALLAGLVPSQADVDVVIWEPGRQAAPHSPRSLLRLDAREVSFTEFAGQVDVMVVGCTPGRGGHLHRVATTALAHGCVPVLGPEFRDHFGDAALYLEEKSVSDWVEELRESPDLVARQRARGAAFVQQQLSAASVQGHVVIALQDPEEPDL